MNAKRISMALLLLLLATAPAAAIVTQTPYQINPGGLYRYLPSPFTSIPGGMPSEDQLDFGIGGTFVYEFRHARAECSPVEFRSLPHRQRGRASLPAASRRVARYAVNLRNLSADVADSRRCLLNA